MSKALLLVDIQNDFLPGGALAVPSGDEVISVANQIKSAFDIVVATQDWHPANHQSFASQHAGHAVGDVVDLNGLSQILWPDHCVQDSRGAEFAASLDLSNVHVVQKGTNIAVDSYSGFFDNGQREDTGMERFLREKGVGSVAVLGLATDYCVKSTALDAARLGFATTLIKDGCRGVNLEPGDCEQAIADMRSAGIQIATSNSITDGP